MVCQSSFLVEDFNFSLADKLSPFLFWISNFKSHTCLQLHYRRLAGWCSVTFMLMVVVFIRSFSFGVKNTYCVLHHLHFTRYNRILEG